MGLNIGYLQSKTDKASDEVYTPEYAIEVLIPYIKQYKTNHNKDELIIWCPFDEDWSNYVKILSDIDGVKVINTHIDDDDEGKHNFFIYEPEKYDIIISNPPFSIKDDILKRLQELNKPYAMLLPVPVIQGQKRFSYMTDCQIMTFNKRINYYKTKEMKEIQRGVSFGSLYLCKDFLPKDLIWKEI